MAVDPDVLLAQEKIQSYFKHRFLHHYAPQFVRKLSANGDQVAVVDGFSGRPHDDNGAPGSAPVLVTLAHGHDNVHVTLMERSARYVAELEEYVEGVRAGNTDSLHVEIVHGDTRQNLPEVVDGYEGAHLLMYLDPCGYGVAFDDLVEMVGRRPAKWPSTEFILNFGSGLVERIGGGYFKGTDDGSKLTSACGGDWWVDVAKEHLDRDGNWSNALTGVVKEVNRRLSERTGKHLFTVPIRSKPHVRPMFHMVCATPSGDGVFALGDSFARAWDNWSAEDVRRASVGTLFEEAHDSFADHASTRGVAEAKAMLREDVLANVRSDGSGYVVGKSAHLFARVLGRLTDAEIGQELRAMAAEEQIRLEKGRRPSMYKVYPA